MVHKNRKISRKDELLHEKTENFQNLFTKASANYLYTHQESYRRPTMFFRQLFHNKSSFAHSNQLESRKVTGNLQKN